MIELKITAENIHALHDDLRLLLGGEDFYGDRERAAQPIDFVAAKAAQAHVYEPDADDEAEVNPDMVQAVDEIDVVDSAGEVWDEAIHSPNRTTTKDGRWRLKKGAVRPESVEETPATSTADTVQSVAATDDEDEFAAFTAAAALAVEAVPVEIPARTWTDADMSKLCNMAAQKLGGGEPVKKLIAEYVTEGEVPHSRNVPTERREDFAQAIEALAGIEYAG